MIQLSPLHDFLRQLRRKPALHRLEQDLLPVLTDWHPLLAAHSLSVARSARRLAADPSTPPIPPDLAFQAALLHDLGKLFLSPAVAVRCSACSPIVPTLVHDHPSIGYHLLRTTAIPPSIQTAVLHHHEHWDGSGYPLRLARSDIPRVARLVTLADTFDGLTAGPPIGRSLGVSAALEELGRRAGAQLDPELVRAALPILAGSATPLQEIRPCIV